MESGKMTLTNTQIQLAEQLLLSVINRESVVYYNELGNRVSPPVFQRQVWREIGEVSKLCKELELPLLSAKVIGKLSGVAGEGLFGLMAELGIDTRGKSEKELLSEELKKIRECTEWYRLADHLGLDLDLPQPLETDTHVNEIDLKSVKHNLSKINTKLSICEYFLSKFDMQAVNFLGFNTRDEAMVSISKKLGKENNYLKRRRDEFDVLTGSHRKGQRNRPPVADVLRIHNELKDLSFQELADRVQEILSVPNAIYPDDLLDNSPEYREGKKKTVQVNTYERNPAARQACINHYGATCYVCGFDFGKTYGSKYDGMIHVHHLKMVSEADDEYTVNPINDLRPVCPNCHMVLHSKREEGYTIEEVKEMLGLSE
jgi:predicted HNH restriction endonuclease